MITSVLCAAVAKAKEPSRSRGVLAFLKAHRKLLRREWLKQNRDQPARYWQGSTEPGNVVHCGADGGSLLIGGRGWGVDRMS